MENKLAKKKRGRPAFMVGATTTTISIEENLLERVRNLAYRQNQSVSQWLAQAAVERLQGKALAK